MKKLLPLLILIFTFTAFGQIKRENGVFIEYDKFKDETTVRLMEYGKPGLAEASFSYNGRTLVANVEHFYIYFAGDCPGFCFHDDALIMLIDGERVPLGIDKGLGDSAVYAVSRDTIERIAAAKLVEYQVGRFEDKWETKTLAKFKTLLDLGTVKK